MQGLVEVWLRQRYIVIKLSWDWFEYAMDYAQHKVALLNRVDYNPNTQYVMHILKFYALS